MTEQKLVLSGKLDSGIEGLSLTGGKNNTYVGLGAGANGSSLGGNNAFVGAYSGANATAESSVFIGVRSGRRAQLAKESVFIGYKAGEKAERVDSSICIGPYSGQKMKRANNNTILGYQAGAELTSGSRNTVVGSFAAFQQFNGHDNVCIGHRSGYKNQIGANNCYIGTNSGFSAVSGYENVCMGVGSGQFLSAGTKNVLCGFLAGNAISNASNCIAIGTRTMEYFANGDTNTCMGTFTAQRFSGNNNTILGGYTASNASGDYNTVVGSRSMNRRNNWKVDLQSSVIIGENVQFEIPITVKSASYDNAVVKLDAERFFGRFEIEMSPTADVVLPFERYLTLGQYIWHYNEYANKVVDMAKPLTFFIGSAPYYGYYRVIWGHETTGFPDYEPKFPTKYELYIGPNDQNSDTVQVTHLGEGVPIGPVTAPQELIPIASALAEGNVVTITTVSPHGIDAGRCITLVSAPPITGTWVVTNVTETTFTFQVRDDILTPIDLGNARLWLSVDTFVPTEDQVYVRLSIDGYIAFAYLFPKSPANQFIDIIVEHINYLNTPSLNLLFRHTPPGFPFPDEPVDGEIREYLEFEVAFGYIHYVTPPGESVIGEYGQDGRVLPGSEIKLKDVNIFVVNGIGTFTTEVALVDPLSPAALDEMIVQSGNSINSDGYARLVNHRLMIPGGEVYINKSTSAYLDGFWTIKDVTSTHSTTGTCTFTIDFGALKLADGRYPLGYECAVYISRVSFTRPSDGLAFFKADGAFAAQYGVPVNPRAIYMYVPKGHNLVAGGTVYFDHAADARLNKTFVVETPGLGNTRGDVWAKFDVGFDPGAATANALFGSHVLQYAACLEKTRMYADFSGYAVDPPDVDFHFGSSYVSIQPYADPGDPFIVYSSRSDETEKLNYIVGPSGVDDHFHVGAGSQAIMDANISNSVIEFTNLGLSRAVYSIGRYITRIAIMGDWVLPPGDISFGIEWLSQYKITCTKTTSNGVPVFDVHATNTYANASIEIARVDHSFLKLYGSITGPTLPIPITDVMTAAVPRAEVTVDHIVTNKTIDITIRFLRGVRESYIDPADEYNNTDEVVSITKIRLLNIAAPQNNDGTTLEFFANAFTKLDYMQIFTTQIRESPAFSNVVYLGSSHVVANESDRTNVFITSLGPYRIIRGDIDVFQVYSNRFKVPAIETTSITTAQLDADTVVASGLGQFGTVTVSGNVIGGLGQFGTVTVSGDVIGGLGQFGAVTVNGNVIGGLGQFGAVTVNGDVIGGLGQFGTVTVNGQSSMRDIIPQVSNAYSLGSLGERWKDLYVSEGSVHIGNVVLSSEQSTMIIDGNVSANYFVGNGQYITGLTTPVTISNVSITDADGVDVDDTSLGESTYLKIVGTSFGSGAVAMLGSVSASTTIGVSQTELRARFAGIAAGTYSVFVINTDGTSAVLADAVTWSEFPAWSDTDLQAVTKTRSISQTVAASGDSSIVYTASGLPPGTTLDTSGVFSGTISEFTDMTSVYSFTVTATDAELQNTPKTFSLTSGYIRNLAGNASIVVTDSTYTVDTNHLAVSTSGGYVKFTALNPTFTESTLSIDDSPVIATVISDTELQAPVSAAVEGATRSIEIRNSDGSVLVGSLQQWAFPVWTTASAQLGAAIYKGDAFSRTVAATHGAGGVTFAAISGFPSGVSVNSSGTVSGTVAFGATNEIVTLSIDAVSTVTLQNATREFTLSLLGKLFAYTSHTFTNAGVTGRDGPSLAQCRAAYTTTWDETYLTMVTNGIQRFEVPATGTYRITAKGAAGGNSPSNGTFLGGNGAIVQSNHILTIGTILQILVGQMGQNDPSPSTGYGAGSGGGSFVVRGTSPSTTTLTDLLIAAGGGSGAMKYGNNNNGRPGVFTLNGENAVTAGGAGGTNGNGGAGANYSGGGGGFLTRGGNLTATVIPTDCGGLAFVNGGRGGDRSTAGGGDSGSVGGFGGGAGQNLSAGGGGGASGGGGGSWSNGLGGGGGSYSATTRTNVGTGAGHGYVTIELLST